MTDRLTALEDLKAKVEVVEWNPYQTHWPSGDNVEGLVERAYNGSLDAALALHNAVPTSKAIMSAEDMAIVLFGNDGARHFLAWKLDALIEKEKTND